MKIGLIGLGRMGSAIAYRLITAGHEVIGFDYNQEARASLQAMGGRITATIEEICLHTTTIWLMVPVTVVDEILHRIVLHVQPNTIIIDGGNSYYKDSIRRAGECTHRHIEYLDCGTSGGVHGREYGFCLMVGGDIHTYKKIYPLLAAIATPDGLAHVGTSGSGHYVKMVHNGIEYGILQAYAEGFQVIKEGSFKNEKLDLAQITSLWNHGSIIRSWILSLAHDIFTRDQTFDSISGTIEELGTGKWTLLEAQEHHIQTPVLQESLKVRAQSRESGGNYATKIVALLRNTFGGHPISKKE